MEVNKLKRILIIEDDEKLRCELETFLNKNGFVATSLNKFDNAVEDILNEKADLLLLYKFTIYRWRIYLQRSKKNI